MKDTANIAGKMLLSFCLDKCVFPRISDEEWEALGVSPSRAREEEKQADAERSIQRSSSFT
ncbi:MAG: hypothetical protein HY936_01585 [Nitrosomonadales bacterium]|nr:hypothetical protein [Nitrosomonadales bacterium]